MHTTKVLIYIKHLHQNKLDKYFSYYESLTSQKCIVHIANDITHSILKAGVLNLLDFNFCYTTLWVFFSEASMINKLSKLYTYLRKLY